MSKKLTTLCGERLRAWSCPPWATPLIPSTSVRFGPPRRRSSIAEYFSRHPGAFTQVYPRRPAPAIHADWLGAAPSTALKHRAWLPPDHVFTLRGARLLGDAGWIVGDDDTLLTEASFWREADHPHPFSSHYILRRKSSRPLRRLPGRTVSLASDFASGGFGHLIHDSLPRLHLLEQAGHKLADFDWIYLPRIDTPSARRLISRLGIPAGRLLAHDPAFDLLADELVATTYPGTPGYLPAYTPQFLRSRFGPSPARTGRRIFLSREGFRRDLARRGEIETLLRAHGFEIIRADRDDALQACAEAGCVVGQEGANFMNALFCPPGARLLLLLPDYVDLPYALTLAASGGHSIWVQSVRTSPHDVHGPVTLDLALFTRTLDRLLS